MRNLPPVKNLAKIGPNWRKRHVRLIGITMSMTKYRIKRKEHHFHHLRTDSHRSPSLRIPSIGPQARMVPPLSKEKMIIIIITNLHQVKSLKSNRHQFYSKTARIVFFICTISYPIIKNSVRYTYCHMVFFMSRSLVVRTSWLMSSGSTSELS